MTLSVPGGSGNLLVIDGKGVIEDLQGDGKLDLSQFWLLACEWFRSQGVKEVIVWADGRTREIYENRWGFEEIATVMKKEI